MRPTSLLKSPSSSAIGRWTDVAPSLAFVLRPSLPTDQQAARSLVHQRSLSTQFESEPEICWILMPSTKTSADVALFSSPRPGGCTSPSSSAHPPPRTGGFASLVQSSSGRYIPASLTQPVHPTLPTAGGPADLLPSLPLSSSSSSSLSSSSPGSPCSTGPPPLAWQIGESWASDKSLRALPETSSVFIDTWASSSSTSTMPRRPLLSACRRLDAPSSYSLLI